MSWKPEVKVVNEDKWHQNALVFATQKEAEDNARDLFSRWTAATDHRAVESDAPVNYSYHDGKLEAVKTEGA
jgi:hypothetical protein